MSFSIMKFNRPAITLVSEIGKGVGPLSLSGSFIDAEVESAYTGSVDVVNSIGDFTVELVAGELPPGSEVSADNLGQRVVITWPQWDPNVAPVKNPGFEDLLDHWEPGPGWIPTSDNPIAGLLSAGYINNGGRSVISSKSRYKMKRGTSVTAKCAVRQGGSSAGNAGAFVRLEVRESLDGPVIQSVDGNAVMSASNNAVKTSTVTYTSPNDRDVYVGMAGVGIRNKQNRLVWIDNFEWNLLVSFVGVDTAQSIPITIKVTDSAGRTYQQDYVIEVNDALQFMYNSSVYPVTVEDGMTNAAYFVSAHTTLAYRLQDQPAEDFLSNSAYFVSAETNSTFIQFGQFPDDFISNSAYFVSAIIRQIQKTHTQPPEDLISYSASFGSAVTKVVLVPYTMDPEGITYSARFVGAQTNVP